MRSRRLAILLTICPVFVLHFSVDLNQQLPASSVALITPSEGVRLIRYQKVQCQAQGMWDHRELCGKYRPHTTHFFGKLTLLTFYKQCARPNGRSI